MAKNFRQRGRCNAAEKFFLLLETIRSRTAEEEPRPIIRTPPHIPIKVDSPRKK